MISEVTNFPNPLPQISRFITLILYFNEKLNYKTKNIYLHNIKKLREQWSLQEEEDVISLKNTIEVPKDFLIIYKGLLNSVKDIIFKVSSLFFDKETLPLTKLDHSMHENSHDVLSSSMQTQLLNNSLSNAHLDQELVKEWSKFTSKQKNMILDYIQMVITPGSKITLDLDININDFKELLIALSICENNVKLDNIHETRTDLTVNYPELVNLNDINSLNNLQQILEVNGQVIECQNEEI